MGKYIFKYQRTMHRGIIGSLFCHYEGQNLALGHSNSGSGGDVVAVAALQAVAMEAAGRVPHHLTPGRVQIRGAYPRNQNQPFKVMVQGLTLLPIDQIRPDQAQEHMDR